MLDCSFCSAEHVFAARKGQKGRQGMLLARLHDTATARVVLVVSVHLKAKAGAENDQLREQQVGVHTSCSPSALGLPAQRVQPPRSHM